MSRRTLSFLIVFVLIVSAIAVRAFLEARSDPVVRRATILLPHWPAGQAPIRVVLLSDLHVGSASSDPKRLSRVVALTNTLRPDLVLIAGDFLEGRNPVPRTRSARLLAPLSGFRAPLGVAAVLGNHDYETGRDAILANLADLRIRLLDNRATEIGPIALGGISDAVTHHNHDFPVFQRIRRLPGAPVVMTHSPELAPWMPLDVPLLLAGHTHCGQVVLPIVGMIDFTSPFSRFASLGRYRCGRIRDPSHATIVTAGIGTSSAPFRLGAPPDLWLLTLSPEPAAGRPG